MFDETSPNAAQYSYERKSEGALKRARTLLIVLYVVFPLVFLGVCAITSIWPLFAVCPIFLWMLIFFTWRYVSYDVSYVFESGLLTFNRVRVGRKGARKTIPILALHVKDATYAGRADGEAAQNAAKAQSKIYELSSSLASSDRVLLCAKTEHGKDVAVYFDATNKVARLIIAYNRIADFGDKQFKA